jgi:muramoyltetrapeptide carboxypeptidase
MLTQLRDAGHLAGLSAVLIGSIKTPARTHFPPDRRLIDVLREVFVPLGIPVVRGVPTGHRRRSHPLPLGAEVQVDTRAGRIRFR